MTTISFHQLAGGSLEIEHAGISYKFANLGMKHWAEFCQYVGFLQYHKAKQNDAPKEILDELFREGLNKKLQIDSNEVLQAFRNPIAIVKLMEISLNIGNTGISEKIKAEIFNTDAYVEVLHSFLELIGLGTSETNEGDEEKVIPPS